MDFLLGELPRNKFFWLHIIITAVILTIVGLQSQFGYNLLRIIISLSFWIIIIVFVVTKNTKLDLSVRLFLNRAKNIVVGFFGGLLLSYLLLTMSKYI